MVLIDSVFKMDVNYYLQVFLKKYKYIVKEKEATKHITEKLEIFSDNLDESDEE